METYYRVYFVACANVCRAVGRIVFRTGDEGDPCRDCDIGDCASGVAAIYVHAYDRERQRQNSDDQYGVQLFYRHRCRRRLDLDDVVCVVKRGWSSPAS